MPTDARGLATVAAIVGVILVLVAGGLVYDFYYGSPGSITTSKTNSIITSARTRSNPSSSVITSTTATTQTFCSVAELISPTLGSTLPPGAVTFEWCNANADYFLTVESVPGAHDIFYAFAGGVGPGAGVVSVTLGPACAATIPTGCIPSNGETVHLSLWTLKKGVVVPPSPFSYTFVAA